MWSMGWANPGSRDGARLSCNPCPTGLDRPTVLSRPSHPLRMLSGAVLLEEYGQGKSELQAASR